jgi:hypothetical protein
MACVAPFPDASVFAYDDPPVAGPPCAAGVLDIAARGAVVVPDEAIGQVVDLTRARAGLGVASGPVWARLRLGATRSADADSYVGIAGEAWVPVVEHAAVGGTWRGFTGEVGLVPDPWVYAGNRAWGLDALTPTFAEGLAWIPASDAGASLWWRGFGDRVDLTATLVSGEGANRRERNEGKDVAGSLSVAPMGTSALVVSVYGRNGSRGLGYVPAHRAGARVSGEVGRFGYGVEGLLAWGVGDDATRAPSAASAWLRARPIGPLLLALRGDAWSEDLARPEALAWRALGGAGVSVDVPGGALVALAGADHVAFGEAVAPFPGAPVAAASTTVYLHVGLELGVRSEVR